MGRSGRPAFGAGGAPPAPTKTTLPSSSNAHAPTSTSNRSTKSAKRESRARAVCSAFLGSFEPSIVTSKSLSEGSLRNSSRAQAQLADPRDLRRRQPRATSESSGGGRPAVSPVRPASAAASSQLSGRRTSLCGFGSRRCSNTPRGISGNCISRPASRRRRRGGRGGALVCRARARRRSCCCGGGTGACHATALAKRWLRRACGSAAVTESF